MANKTLAVKYRPQSWSTVVEQGSTVTILQQQLKSNDLRNAYLFCGSSGCGKTTCARIFAKHINNFQGTPIEMDAASNSGVDDVRNIINMAQTRSLDSEYKVFIIDEAHSISNTGWQAFLKTIEEPPAKSIFIFCTTDPQRIPKTILNRVQRYDFKRISTNGIVERLKYILEEEGIKKCEEEAIEFLARQAKGGMRDAISLLDKCLAYSDKLTMDNVLDALELSDTNTFLDLTDSVLAQDRKTIIDIVEEIYASGEDMKQFIKQYMNFVLDVNKWLITEMFEYTQLPETDDIKDWLKGIQKNYELDDTLDLQDKIIELDSNIKYNTSPKEYIEAVFLTF